MFKQSFLQAITVKNILYFISILVLCIFAIILKFGFTGYSFLSLCLLFTALIVFLYFMLSLRKNRITKILKIIFTILVSLLVTAIIIAEIPILNTSTKREKANSPYCIVLGAAVHGDSPSLVLWERIQAAYDFLSQNPESIAILSGGQGPGENISEAQCMFENLMEMGIPRERLFLEDRSTSTIENILFSHDIIEELSPGTKDFTIISSETHLYRACLAAQELGFIPSAFYAKTKKTMLRFSQYLREGFAVWVMWLF